MLRILDSLHFSFMFSAHLPSKSLCGDIISPALSVCVCVTLYYFLFQHPANHNSKLMSLLRRPTVSLLSFKLNQPNNNHNNDSTLRIAQQNSGVLSSMCQTTIAFIKCTVLSCEPAVCVCTCVRVSTMSHELSCVE